MSGTRRKRRVDFEVPLGAPRSKCRACHAAIAWITTGEKPDGSPRRMPLHLASILRDFDSTPRAESHFAHCPHADRLRAGR